MSATEFVRLKPAELRPADYNPRVITKRDFDALRRSIRRFGVMEPLVARRSDRLLLAGHQRLRAAMAEGLADLPVVLVDCDDAEARTLNVALNKIGGSWDVPKLAELLADLACREADLALTGFDDREVDRLLGVLGGRDDEEMIRSADALTSEPATDAAQDTTPAEVRCPRCGKRFAPVA